MYSSHYNLLGILLAYDPTVKETKSSNPCGVCAAELLEYAHDVGRTGTFRLLIAPAFAMWLCSWAPPMQKQSLSNSAHPGWGTENNSVCKVRTGRRGWGCHFYRARCPATSSLPPLRDCRVPWAEPWLCSLLGHGDSAMEMSLPQAAAKSSKKDDEHPPAPLRRSHLLCPHSPPSRIILARAEFTPHLPYNAHESKRFLPAFQGLCTF